MDKAHTKNDDHVLFCAMLLQRQLQQRSATGCTVALVTDDRTLRVKANTNSLLGLGMEDIPRDLDKVRAWLVRACGSAQPRWPARLDSSQRVLRGLSSSAGV